MSDYDEMVNYLRESYNNGVMESLDNRKKQLEAFKKMINENEEEFCNVMWKDLHKSRIETLTHELEFLKSEINEAISNLKSWNTPVKVTRFILQAIDSAYVKPEPLGVALIIGAWNFPIRLLLGPMVGALAAGNVVILKPSELSVNTSKLIANLVPKYFNKDVVQVVQGGVNETTELLKQRFDHIFYTGNPNVGKIIMKAASEHLTPVTLELGGKNPVIIDSSADLHTLARRIVWGKFTNCGQICVTGDYVLNLHPEKEKLIEEIKIAINEFYGDNQKECQDYGRIVNHRHWDRLNKLIEGTEGKIVYGGDKDRDNLYIQPTVLTDIKETDVMMQDEIFGPFLPIIDIQTIEEAVNFIKKREKSLALYMFSTNNNHIDYVIGKTSSGAVCVNDIMMHMSLETLPFGGVGNSGMGCYHGKHTFDAFSHKKSVLHRAAGFEKMLFMRYPPYTENKLSWARKLCAKWKLPF